MSELRIFYSYKNQKLVFEQPTSQVVIGRPTKGAAIDLDLDLSPDLMVSRPPARIWVEDNQFWIKDLDSSGGTRVGSREIRRGIRNANLPEAISHSHRRNSTLRGYSGASDRSERGRNLQRNNNIGKASGNYTHTWDANVPFLPLKVKPMNVAIKLAESWHCFMNCRCSLGQSRA